MSKQAMREAERPIRDDGKLNLVIKQGNTRTRQSAANAAREPVQAEKGATRVKLACKQCGHKQENAVSFRPWWPKAQFAVPTIDLAVATVARSLRHPTGPSSEPCKTACRANQQKPVSPSQNIPLSPRQITI
jgi:hypothetical protein